MKGSEPHYSEKRRNSAALTFCAGRSLHTYVLLPFLLGYGAPAYLFPELFLPTGRAAGLLPAAFR